MKLDKPTPATVGETTVQSPPSPRGYDAIADTLAQGGIQRIFGVLGDDTAPLMVATSQRGIRYYPVRHENQAIAMADGYSRATGRIGVATVTGGPGLCNGLTALFTAHRASSRILLVTGCSRTAEDDLDDSVIRQITELSWLKWFPHVKTLNAMGISSFRPQTATEVVPETRAALARAQRGPAVLVYGRDLVLGHIESVPAEVEDELSVIEPDPEQITQLADLLQESWAINRPVIIAGRGAVESGAGPALRRLGELTGALMATSLPATALFHGDPFDIGVCGTYSTPVASDLIPQADCVLAFGAGLNVMTTYKNTMFPKAMVVQVDTVRANLGRFMNVELAIEADAALAARALVSELERRGHSLQGFRTEQTRSVIAGFRKDENFRDKSTSELIDPRALMLELDRIMPPERILCADGGQQSRFALRCIGVQQPRNFLQALEGAGIGLGIGLAMGAAVGRPGEPLMLAVGDTATMMSLGDLESAVRLHLPILVVVSNDGALGSEVSVLTRHGMDTSIAQVPSPSFEAVAAALGAWSATVRRLVDLAIVHRWMRERPGVPLVLDCRVNPKVRDSWPA